MISMGSPIFSRMKVTLTLPYVLPDIPTSRSCEDITS